MKKKLYIILGVIVGLALAGYLVLVFGTGALVTTAVNRYGPLLAKTNVHLTEAHISPLSGSGTLDHLVVGNPPGWSSNNAFELKTIHISAVPSSLFSDHVIIKEIEIDGPEILYETHVVSSNLGDLIKGLKHDQARGTEDAKTTSGKTIHFEVQHLLIKNGVIKFGVGPAAVPLDMPTVDLHDLGSGNGITSTQLATIISETILKSAVQGSAGAIGKLGSGALAIPGDALKLLKP